VEELLRCHHAVALEHYAEILSAAREIFVRDGYEPLSFPRKGSLSLRMRYRPVSWDWVVFSPD
jgi:hypothetical protein